MSKKMSVAGETIPDASLPPAPPETTPRLRLYGWQWIGLPFLFLIPVLALFGIFGITTEQVLKENDFIQMKATYPNKLRYMQWETLEIEIRNKSSQPLSGVTLGVDRSYLSGFSSVSFTPEVTDVIDPWIIVNLGTLPPKQVRTVNVEMQPTKYWMLSGSLALTTKEGGALSAPLQSFVFP